MVDIRDLAGRSLIVFRGRVATVDLIGENPHPSIRRNAVAVFQADRWYRGEARAIPPLSFTFGTVFSNGHNCIDFRPDSYWIVFAVETSGHLELIDDCIGALTVAPLLGANLGNADWLVQMEADFIAGLER